MRKYLILFIILTGTNLFASAPDTIWTRVFGGIGTEEGWNVQQTTDGGYIVCGYTSSFGAGSDDIYLIKTNSSGDTLWTKTFGGTGSDYGYSLQQTTDSGYILCGYTSSFGAGGSDIYLIKTNSSGDTLWTKTYGGTGSDYGYSVQQTTDSGYIVCGYTYSFGAGGSDAWLIKTDGNGDTLWTKTFGGTGSDYGHSVQQTTDGGYIVCGYTYSFGAGGSDAWLIKTDGNGDTLWTKTFGGTDSDNGWSAQQTGDGGFIVNVITYSFGAGSEDVWLVKTDSMGNTLWTKTYGGTSYDYSYVTKQTKDGGYIICGHTESFGVGQCDVWPIKTDSIGDTLWTKLLGGAGEDCILSLQQTTDGGYILSGRTSSFGTGSSDVWLIRLATEASVEEPSILDRGLQNAELKIIKNKICLSVPNSSSPNNYYTNTLLTNVQLTIYDLCGRPKEVVYSGTLTKGNYTFTPNITKSGVYFVRLTAGNYKETKKITIIR
ncbi:MAG: T9SS type A sorting domain-containing protein [bacterium]|nr:T9SS type A sorting domain-containing protein [bacterium]